MWMLVEDDESIREMLMLMMRLWGVDPLPFRHGLEAMAWLDRVERGTYKACMPELALLDLHLPGVGGQEVGYRMRHLRATAHIPIVVMSGFIFGRAEERVIREMVQPDQMVKKPLP